MGLSGYKVCLKGEPGVRVVVSRNVVFNEQKISCPKPVYDLVNITNFSSNGTIPIEVKDTSDHTLKHTLAPESVPNQVRYQIRIPQVLEKI